jgi:hypothetical protein
MTYEKVPVVPIECLGTLGTPGLTCAKKCLKCLLPFRGGTKGTRSSMRTFGLIIFWEKCLLGNPYLLRYFSHGLKFTFAVVARRLTHKHPNRNNLFIDSPERPLPLRGLFCQYREWLGLSVVVTFNFNPEQSAGEKEPSHSPMVIKSTRAVYEFV